MFKFPPLAHAAAVVVEIDTFHSSVVVKNPGAFLQPKPSAEALLDPAPPNEYLPVARFEVSVQVVPS